MKRSPVHFHKSPPSRLEKIMTGFVFLFASGLFDPQILPQFGSLKINDFVIAGACSFGLMVLFSKCQEELRDIEWNRLALLIVFYIFIGFSVAWNDIPLGGFLRFIGFSLVSFWTLYLVLRFSMDEILRILVSTLLAIALASAFFAFFIPQIGTMTTFLEQGDWSGVYRQKNTLGRQMMLLVLISTFCITCYRNRLLPIMGITIGFAVLIMTGSRTAFGLTMLGLILITGIHFSKQPWVLATVLLLGGSVGVFAAYNALIQDIPLFLVDAETVTLLGAGLSLTGRLGVWQYAAEWIEKSPWFGYGYDGFWKIRQKIDGQGEASEWIPSDAHNGYIDLILQVGFIGTAFFILIYVIFISRAVNRTVGQESQPRERFAFFILVFFLLSNLTESYLLKATNMVQLLFTFSIILLCLRKHKNQQIETQQKVLPENNIHKNPFFKER